MGLQTADPYLNGGITNIFLRKMRQSLDAFSQRQACRRKLLHLLLKGRAGIECAGAELSVPCRQFTPVFIGLALELLRKKRDDHASGKGALRWPVVLPF